MTQTDLRRLSHAVTVDQKLNIIALYKIPTRMLGLVFISHMILNSDWLAVLQTPAGLQPRFGGEPMILPQTTWFSLSTPSCPKWSWLSSSVPPEDTNRNCSKYMYSFYRKWISVSHLTSHLIFTILTTAIFGW